MCNTCSKEYKTKVGLTRHVNTHDQAPSSNVQELTSDQLCVLIKDMQTSLSANKNYPENIRCHISNIAVNEINLSKLHGDITPLYNKLVDTSNAEHFISMFYGYIVRNATAYIPNIAPQVGKLLLKKVGDKIFHHYKKSITQIK